MNNQNHMHRCLELAERGRGLVGTNPLVGAVLTRGDKVIAEGWHMQFGTDHAERMLIKKFDQEFKADDVLYVNLEPCFHHGKTPPCTDLIIESGIKHVVYGMKDPNPEVVGQGIAQLRKAGIQVDGPVLSELCERLNRGYLSILEKGRPYITLKKAQSSDGSIANEDGSQKKITSDEQDKWSHTYLRSKHDAILVGVQTIVTDDPELTIRFMNKKVDQVIPLPLGLALDPHLRIPLTAKRVNGELAKQTIIIADRDAKSDSEHELLSRGVRILRIPMKDGVFDWQVLWSMLTTPHDNFFGITSILVEGGVKTWESFRNAEQYDEDVVLVG